MTSYDVPVPFACGDVLGPPVKKLVLQCALSRICGMCGRPLSWGAAFVGSPEEAEANAFHFPPLHQACADEALAPTPGSECRCSARRACSTRGPWS